VRLWGMQALCSDPGAGQALLDASLLLQHLRIRPLPTACAKILQPVQYPVCLLAAWGGRQPDVYHAPPDFQPTLHAGSPGMGVKDNGVVEEHLIAADVNEQRRQAA
jgi:hypothetical protein